MKLRDDIIAARGWKCWSSAILKKLTSFKVIEVDDEPRWNSAMWNTCLFQCPGEPTTD